MLNNKLYTLPPSFVEIYMNMIKLCCLNKDNPRFSAFEYHAELSELSEFIEKNEWSSEFSRFESAGLSRMRTMQENYHNFRRSLRRLMSWKSPCGLLGKSCHKKTHWQGGGELHQALDCIHGCSFHWWSLWASAVTLSIKSASSSHHQQTGSFHIHQQTTGEQNTKLERLRNGGCLGLNSIILLFSDIFRQNLVLKHIFLLNSCVVLYAKSAWIDKISKKIYTDILCSRCIVQWTLLIAHNLVTTAMLFKCLSAIANILIILLACLGDIFCFYDYDKYFTTRL